MSGHTNPGQAVTAPQLDAMRELPGTAKQIAAKLGKHPNEINGRMRLLRDRGWVDTTKQGRELLYALTDAGANALHFYGSGPHSPQEIVRHGQERPWRVRPDDIETLAAIRQADEP